MLIHLLGDRDFQNFLTNFLRNKLFLPTS